MNDILEIITNIYLQSEIMELNKQFESFKRFSKEEIHQFQSINGMKIPSGFQTFLEVIGGQELIEDDTFAYYVDISIFGESFPFIEFFTLDKELLRRLNNLDGEEYYTILNKDDYLPIGWGHGQNRILIGTSETNFNQIFILNDEEVILTYLCDSLETFINEYLKLENELSDYEE